MDFLELYSYDKDGFFEGPILFQVMEGVFPPDRTTQTALPEDADLEKNFYKWDGEKWVAEAKPTKVEDLLGIVVSHKSQTAHDEEMRQIIQKLGTAEGYRIVRGEGDDMTWMVEKIPEEEIDAQAIDAELSEFDQQIASLKDRLATATLQDDAETVAALKAEYKTLKEG